MEAAMGSDRVPGTDVASGVGAAGAQLPLAMVGAGETVRVLRVRGGQELRQHLAEMGFVEGTEVRMVSRANGNAVVSVKGATFGLGRDMAMRIVTC